MVLISIYDAHPPHRLVAINWHYLAEVEVTSVFGGKKMGTTSKNFSQPSQRYLWFSEGY